MRQQIVQRQFAQIGDQHQMPTTQQRNCWAQFGLILITQVGQQHDQRPLALPLQDQLRCFGVIGWINRRLQVIDGIDQRGQPTRPGTGRQLALFAAETLHPDRIALAQGHIRQQDHGVQRVIEMAEIVILGAHPPAAIQQEQHGLIALILIVASNRFPHPGRRLPIDLPQAVANPVFTQLQESLTIAAPPSSVNTEQRLAPFRRQPNVSGNSGEIGINPYRSRFAEPIIALPPTTGRFQPDLHRVKLPLTANHRSQPVTEFGPAAGFDGHGLREIGAIGGAGRVVVKNGERGSL